MDDMPMAQGYLLPIASHGKMNSSIDDDILSSLINDSTKIQSAFVETSESNESRHALYEMQLTLKNINVIDLDVYGKD
jgi:hypothetical protein